ncbi:hypothetical protein EZS27_007101 [termite gut metagenome]|uniref:Methyltransferase FkbM domain-containing protein n=1 Tax=termite gut metagenome TaxID=433724 RepID=A0A5J4SGY9_9ZZZZ
MLTQLYRKYVSQELRDKIYQAFLGQFLVFVRNFRENTKCLFIYLFQWFLPKTPENKCYTFMGKYGLTPYPYPFMLEYKKMLVDYFHDEQFNLPYVVHHGRKLYFPQSYTQRFVVALYKGIITEQDSRSPHRYVKDYRQMQGKILLDIGAAEGIFSLDTIEFAQHTYLFECDNDWMNALNATFAPWKDKVTIISKYVSDRDDESNITIDSFLEGKDKTNLFLKMDIEGYEQAALQGAKNTLKNVRDLDYSICTYHRKNDAEEINKIFLDNHFESEFTEGFLYFEKGLRKGLIRKKS